MKKNSVGFMNTQVLEESPSVYALFWTGLVQGPVFFVTIQAGFKSQVLIFGIAQRYVT